VQHRIASIVSNRVTPKGTDVPKRTTTKTASTSRTSPAKKAAPAKRTTSKAATPVEPVAATSSSNDKLISFLTEQRDLINRYLSDLTGDDAPFTPDNEELDEPAVADEDGEAEEQTREEREAELSKMTVRALQNALIATDEFEEADIKGETDKDTLITNLLDYEFGEDDADEDADEESDEESDEEDEDAEYDEDQLMKLNLAELRKLWTGEFEGDASEVKGKDKDTIVAMILEAQEGEEDEYESDEDDEDADAEEGDDEFWTEEELKKLPIAEIRGIADEAGISYTAAQGKSKVKLIELITEE
jgi:hypothetical protein